MHKKSEASFTDDLAMDNYEIKPHPSEFMEFNSVLTGMAQHIDYAPSRRSDINSWTPPSPSSAGKHLFSPSKSSREIHRDLLATVPDFRNIAKDASAATSSEHHMTFTQALRLYPKAIGWSLLLSLTIVMEGFDITLINSFYAFPQFQERYGQETPSGSFQITTPWQAALTSGSVVGEILGLLCNGLVAERFGNRRTLIGALVMLSAFIFLSFFGKDIEMLVASQILSGLPWGIFQALSTTYAAEVMPVALRAFLTSNVNLCWLIGQLISVGMLRGLISDPSEWSYRIPFALQWMWTIPILLGVMFAPESPWWLIRHERPEEAKQALLRLTNRGEGFNADETINMMKHTNAVEKYMSAGTSYLDCFRGSDLRRTEICCVVWMTQAVCAAMTGYAAYFYEQAGIDTEQAFDLSIGMYCAGICGNILSWLLMRHFGRRTLYIWGCGGCGLSLLASGILGAIPSNQSSTTSWILGSMLVVNTFIYDSTIGPVCYALVAEIPSTRLRVKTVVLARVAYNTLTIVSNVLMPKMLNPTAWDWKGKSCLLWAALSFVCFAWCYFRLPEPKGLTYMELDILFEKKASARKFSKFKDTLTQSGYFSLVRTADGRGEADEWHVNKI